MFVYVCLYVCMCVCMYVRIEQYGGGRTTNNNFSAVVAWPFGGPGTLRWACVRGEKNKKIKTNNKGNGRDGACDGSARLDEAMGDTATGRPVAGAENTHPCGASAATDDAKHCVPRSMHGPFVLCRAWTWEP